MSKGILALIIIGAIVAVIGLFFVLFTCIRRRRKTSQPSNEVTELGGTPINPVEIGGSQCQFYQNDQSSKPQTYEELSAIDTAYHNPVLELDSDNATKSKHWWKSKLSIDPVELP